MLFADESKQTHKHYTLKHKHVIHKHMSAHVRTYIEHMHLHAVVFKKP